MIKSVVLVSLLLLSTSCGNDPEGKSPIVLEGQQDVSTNDGMAADAGNDLSDAGMEAAPDATMSSENAPVVLELEATPAELTEDDSTTINAVVTDPQGAQDIVAGRLLDAESQQLVGTFRSVAGGSFEAVVSWDDLNDVRAITFDATGATRALTAEFIDNSNERSTRSLALTLSCAGLPACEGSCGQEDCRGSCSAPADYVTVDNCGSCGTSCQSGFRCDTGTCTELTDVGSACEIGDCSDIPSEFFSTVCLDEENYLWPGGYCSVPCIRAGQCASGSTCVRIEQLIDRIGWPACARDCSVGSCRSGYECKGFPTADESRTVDVCVPIGL